MTAFRPSLLACVCVLITSCSSTQQSIDRARIRVLSVDLSVEDGRTPSVDNLIELVRAEKPDVVALPNLPRADGDDFLVQLADRTGMTFAFGEVSSSAGVRTGTGFLTLSPILEEKNSVLAVDPPGGLLSLVLDVEGTETSIIIVSVDKDARVGEPALVPQQVMSAVRRTGNRPTLVIGGFGSGTEIVRDSLMTALRDAWPSVGVGDGFTFPAASPARRADELWFTPATSQRRGLRPVSMAVLKARVSDHAPLAAVFEFDDQ